MPAPGDLGRIVQGGKRRPAVVIKVISDEDLLAVAGTGTRRDDYRHVVISPRERTGLLLRLEKPTYFYEGSKAIVKVRAFEAFPGLCTPERFIELSALVESPHFRERRGRPSSSHPHGVTLPP